MLQDRQYESGCLAGSGLRQAYYVPPLHYRWDCLYLYWCGYGITEIMYTGHDARMEIKSIEIHLTVQKTAD